MSRTVSCPDGQLLERLVLGQISEEDAWPLECHLAECTHCARLAEGVPVGSLLVEALRVPSPVLEETCAPELDDLMARLCDLQLRETQLLSPQETPSADLSAELGDILDPPRSPDELGSIGPYRLHRILGSGGMGVVYQAWQPRPHRAVALKLGRRRRRTARVRNETEIIGQLLHPHIVSIHDAGEHRGMPFFTMELMEGGSLSEKLVKAPLPARAAAELVRTLASAVQFAHERGIIHRDLKPSNILLTREGIPKISDFGLAKHLAGDSGSVPCEQPTESGTILGTPAYMAPEQAIGRGKDLGTAGDVYALGAILYECLTGRPPFRAATVLETLEQVRTHEPVPPRQLQPQLPRDLETICLKCLAKEPRRRFASAGALAEELDRFLAGKPIQSRPVTSAERLEKWVRRQPALAVLLAVSVSSLIALVVGVIWYNVRLQGAVAETQRHQERADVGYQAARDTLNQMLGRLERRPLGEVPQLKELQHDLLNDALAFYQGVLAKAQDDNPKVRLDAAGAFARAALIQQMLNRPLEAEQSYRRSLELLESLPGELGRLPDTRSLRAHTLANFGLLLNALGHQEQARQMLQASVDVSQQLVQEAPDDPGLQNTLAEAEHNLGQALDSQNERAEAEEHYQRAVAIRNELIKAHPQEAAYQVALAEDFVNLASLLARTRRPMEAAAAYERCVGLLRPLVAREPANVRYRLALAAACINWSYLLRHTDKAEAALEKTHEAVDLAEGALTREPRYFDAREKAYSAHGSRAELLQAAGRWDDAVKDWDRVVELDDRPDKWVNRVHRTLALARAGQHAKAAVEANLLDALLEVSAEGRYNLACALAIAADRAHADPQLDSASREMQADRYAAQALKLLQALKKEGYFKDSRHLQTLQSDADLAFLRGRAGFQDLLQDDGP